MITRNIRLMLVMSLLCTTNSFGMKRKITEWLFGEHKHLAVNNKPLIMLPDEIIKKIFTDTCYDDLPIRSLLGGSIVEWLVTMRSVCKHWYDLLCPKTIKHIACIHTDNIEADLALIEVTIGSYRNYSHAQFLAQMVKNQIKYQPNVCDSMLRDDPDKLEIFLKNGLVDPSYNDILAFKRRDDKIIACTLVIGFVACCFVVYFGVVEVYKDSCMSGKWQPRDHPWKELINESLCNLCSNLQKSHELNYPSRFVKDYFYTYYDYCNVCNGTDFESEMALYDQCIEDFFESCKNQCSVFNEVYGRWIRMGIEKWSNG